MPNFSPSSVAIIGASNTPGKVGHDVLKNLLTQGYEGKVFPVNPKYESILETPCFPSLLEIPEKVELAIIIVPAKFVPAVLEECGKKQIHTAIIISAGFSEVHTDEGSDLEKQVIELSTKHTIDIVGPNCLGILNPALKMNASFAAELPPAGNIALFSQSGALAVAIMDSASKNGLGFSLVASIGNKAVLTECDFLSYAERDDSTDVVGLYIEDIADGAYFLRTAKSLAEKKRVVLLKSGASDEGKKAAESHTGALAGADEAVDAACKQTGMIRAKSIEEFIDHLRTLSTQPELLTERIAIVTNAGGLGVLGVDTVKKNGLMLAEFNDKTLSSLTESLPAAASVQNPVDVLGDASADRYRATLEALGDDPNVDGIALLLTPQVMTPVEEIAASLVEWNKAYPLVPIVTCFMGGDTVTPGIEILKQGEVPNFPSPERAIRALSVLQKKKPRFHDSRYVTSGMRGAYAREVIDSYPCPCPCPSPRLLPLNQSKRIAELYSLPIPHQYEALSPSEAVERAEEVGYPVVLKLNAPDALHKTEMGGVKLNLKNADDVTKACTDIQNACGKDAPVLIQHQLPPGHEFIVGMVRDPAFGPLVMVGLGGIYTELFADTSFRVCPINQDEAYVMLQELTSWKLLLGMRGKGQADIDGLAQIIATVSQLAVECPAISAIDFNPVIVHEDNVSVADCKIILS